MKKDICFISGPMSTVQDFNVPLFNKVDAYLTKWGYEVRNPAIMPIDWANYEHYLEICYAMIKQCTCVVYLPGASKSKGSNKERKLIKKINNRNKARTTILDISEVIYQSMDLK